jgi:replicative DNA helicase
MSAGIPPQNLEAEQALLGAMMMRRAAIEVATDVGVHTAAFYRPAHRLIHAAIIDLDRTTGQVDELLVVNKLRATTTRHRIERGEDGEQQRIPVTALEDVGGAAVVMTLAERVPSIANARQYAVEVRDQALLRRLVEAGHEIARLGYEHPDEPDALVQQAGVLADELAKASTPTEQGWTTLADELGPMYDQLGERHAGGATIVGLRTGFDDIDERLGGCQDARLMVVAGRPGMGKSVFGSQIAENAALNEDADVAIFNLEMGIDQQVRRSTARMGDIDLHRITSGQPTEQDLTDVWSTIGRVYESAKRVHMDKSSELTSTQIRQRARRLDRKLRREGRRLRMVVIDYLQLVRAGGRVDNRTHEVSIVTRDLKALAIELQIPVIALSQLNRSVEQRIDKRPLMSDLRESGSIEQDADVIVFLYRPEYYQKENTPPEWQGRAEVITAKWRDGMPGSDWLTFDGPRTRFLPGSVGPVFEAGGTRGAA